VVKAEDSFGSKLGTKIGENSNLALLHVAMKLFGCQLSCIALSHFWNYFNFFVNLFKTLTAIS
jgi:hypothetical protein